MWYVYIIECKNGSYYTGITNDVERRVQEHREGKGGKFTRAFGVKTLVYHRGFTIKPDALKREAEIKKWSRSKKQNLINGKWK